MKAVEILNGKNLRCTPCREGIIDIMMAEPQALSENEIRERLSDNFDRTTFFRSFKTLGEHKIIHKIVVDNQLVKYALYNSPNPMTEHAHFYCNICHSVKCLDIASVKPIKLPAGFSDSETEILIKGECPVCNKNTASL
jgi:Fur family ferric uptake transcriptional regulator